MKKRNYLQIWGLCALIITIQGCIYTESPNPKYGTAFNGERERIGLPVLQENWKYNKDEWSDLWINPTQKKDIPYHSSKYVFFNEDTIIWESDNYKGLQEFNTIDGRFKEELFISYYFIEYEGHDIGWRCTLRIATEGISYNLGPVIKTYAMEPFDITKEEADSILVSWGLK